MVSIYMNFYIWPYCIILVEKGIIKFNIAADIVANGMIANEGDCNIPKYGIRDPEIEELCRGDL